MNSFISRPEGLTSDEVRLFEDFSIKANVEQVKAMLSILQGELKKRQLREVKQ